MNPVCRISICEHRLTCSLDLCSLWWPSRPLNWPSRWSAGTGSTLPGRCIAWKDAEIRVTNSFASTFIFYCMLFESFVGFSTKFSRSVIRPLLVNKSTVISVLIQSYCFGAAETRDYMPVRHELQLWQLHLDSSYWAIRQLIPKNYFLSMSDREKTGLAPLLISVADKDQTQYNCLINLVEENICRFGNREKVQQQYKSKQGTERGLQIKKLLHITVTKTVSAPKLQGALSAEQLSEKTRLERFLIETSVT